MASLLASNFRAAARPVPGGNVTCFQSVEKILSLMKKIIPLGLCALFATSLGAQSVAPTDQKQIEALLKIVQDQQIQLAENQAKIDAKLVTLAEAIRVAKIYSSRGGR